MTGKGGCPGERLAFEDSRPSGLSVRSGRNLRAGRAGGGENGLGYNNLLYMAVLLAAIADAPPGDEEPTSGCCWSRSRRPIFTCSFRTC